MKVQDFAVSRFRVVSGLGVQDSGFRVFKVWGFLFRGEVWFFDVMFQLSRKH